ncbi:hypothetical protein QFZ53_001016 [Microbacterium natoriense]|uniref:HNH nuclease domain-containing protein n=1 Tax=Microbacterium natoriense TaxID=284570 RepID=A0AAW8EVF6_9MICO|nr:HNH endonuclease signature motif containing protein [Microbacterium natoriense]MDQ0646820.1 hypothetical protein [Microbacterium natoriense]
MTSLDDEFALRQTLLDDWLEARRQIAVLEARASDLLAARLRVYDADVQGDGFHRDAMHRSMIAEYSASGRIAQGTVERAFVDAFFLQRDYPEVVASFTRGQVTAAHVHEIISAGFAVRDAIDDGRADAGLHHMYEAAALLVAETATPARTKAQVRQIAAALAGVGVTERHRRAQSERTVTMTSVGDGLALLQLVLPEHLAVAILDRLTQVAQHLMSTLDDSDPVLDLDVLDRGDDPVRPENLDAADPGWDDMAIFGESDTFTTDPLVDPLTDDASPDWEHPRIDDRGIDAVRADLATDLLLGAAPTTVTGTAIENIRGRVQVTLSATTLADHDDRPAELDGHGPLQPDAARDFAGHADTWSRLFLSPTGMLVETDAYTPTAAMKRFLRARDPHCRFPGCRMPVHRCQIDHNHDHALGGRTRLDNLSAFCVGHHTLKHPDLDERHRWTARQLPGGEVQWTSPLGRAYVDPPPRRVMFV